MAFFLGRSDFSGNKLDRNSFSGKNKWVVYISIMMITMILIFIYVGRVTRHSAAYSSARMFITQNKCINEHLGAINSIEMRPLRKFYTRNSTALFNLNVDGKKADGKVEIILSKNGKWHVSKAILNVQGREWNCIL